MLDEFTVCLSDTEGSPGEIGGAYLTSQHVSYCGTDLFLVFELNALNTLQGNYPAGGVVPKIPFSAHFWYMADFCHKNRFDLQFVRGLNQDANVVAEHLTACFTVGGP